MKESKIIEIKNKVETLGSVVQTLLTEVNNLKTLSFGNSKVIQNMPDYNEAIEKLKEEAKAETRLEILNENESEKNLEI
tara:strand:+ start:760 stop:996 length:237 start_codon:yes stop_codon:yes gene_type:complete